ncbi:hypothetical protein E2C01_066630 [Portunus trituberculatus]|uniref:Uncharacterized protein n=1 Tax=Portunus trituberculatus TaxID=210409 RepID=A0A5B7HUC6_PORTR|nr:hypothetical protein [Portunus trituberculatus]
MMNGPTILGHYQDVGRFVIYTTAYASPSCSPRVKESRHLQAIHSTHSRPSTLLHIHTSVPTPTTFFLPINFPPPQPPELTATFAHLHPSFPRPSLYTLATPHTSLPISLASDHFPSSASQFPPSFAPQAPPAQARSRKRDGAAGTHEGHLT